jgi:hypothetical protein
LIRTAVHAADVPGNCPRRRCAARASACPANKIDIAAEHQGAVVDVGYRHIQLGKVIGGPSGVLSIDNFSGDEIRVGLRYLLN